MPVYFKKSSKKFLLVVFILLIANSYQGQTQDKEFLEQRVSLSIKTGNLFQLCGGLAYDGIPISFEGAVDFDISRNKNIQVEDGTLKEILDSITKQEPTYKWEYRDGVVNIYPIQFRDEIIESLLKTKIRNFSTQTLIGKEQIANNIKIVNELDTLLKEKQIQLNISTRTNLNVKDETKEFDLSNTELRGILNKIISEGNSDSKFWSIYRTKDGTISLVF